MNILHLFRSKEFRNSQKDRYSKFSTLSFNLSSIQTLLAGNRDRLSEQPEEIVDIILSKVLSQPNNTVTSKSRTSFRQNPLQSQFTTKYVIKNTAVLSKRWRYAWTTCPTLVFITSEFLSIQSFIKFVDTTLETRGKYPLTTFELCWVNDAVDVSCISRWLRYAMQCGVQEILLQVYDMEILKLPPSIFRCPTLEVLDIIAPRTLQEPWMYRSFVELPSSMNLKNLRCLDLQFVKCSSELLEKLISSCTFLESLKLGTCHESIEIFAPNLKTLHLYYTDGPVQIWAPKLESLSCELYSLAEISTEEFEFLVDAYVGYFHELKGKGNKLVKLLKRLRNAKMLNLQGDVMESLSKLDLTKQIFPIFYNLKHLHIETPLAIENINVIIMLLQRCPSLEKLVLCNTKTGNCKLDTSGDYRVPRQLRNACGFPGLKDITISDFYGEKVEFQLVKFLLKEANTLRTMNINGILLPFGDSNVIFRELLAFSRTSSNAKVLLTGRRKSLIDTLLPYFEVLLTTLLIIFLYKSKRIQLDEAIRLIEETIERNL